MKTLSDREFQVMRLIASGKTLSEIAAILSLSDKTISTYRARLHGKDGDADECRAHPLRHPEQACGLKCPNYM